MARHIKKGDLVEVISGARRGLRGKVLHVLRDHDQVIVEGVNMVKRHVRPSRRNPQGGRIEKEAPLHISNVLPVDPKTNKPSRVRFESGAAAGAGRSKKRVTVGGTVLDELTRAER